MNLGKKLRGLAILAIGGAPLITSATCDPYYGTFDFYRDDDYDGYYYEDIYYDDYYYDDCYFFVCF